MNLMEIHIEFYSEETTGDVREVVDKGEHLQQANHLNFQQ